jgi:RNA methyltransferase, TrmH family
MILIAPGTSLAARRGHDPKMSRSEALSSPKNPLLKDVRRAIVRGTLTENGYAVCETFHLLEEALRSELQVKTVLAAESVRSTVETHVKGLRGVVVQVMPDDLFGAISATETAQGVMALVKPPAWTLDHLFRGQSLVVVLDGLQDPGNAGTIVRSAEAFGATGVLFGKGSVSPWNAKTIRSSAGSLFRMPLVAGLDAQLVRAALDQRRIDVYAASQRGKRRLSEVDLTRRCAFIIGSEGHGVSAKLHAGAADLAIPTARVESLNAAVAASILLYEASRQRVGRAREAER